MIELGIHYYIGAVNSTAQMWSIYDAERWYVFVLQCNLHVFIIYQLVGFSDKVGFSLFILG